MSLPVNIHKVLQGLPVEWERLEFKRGWNPEAVLHTLCAFTNDFHNLGGGYIFLGIADDNGRPGLPPAGIPSEQLDSMQKEILESGYKITPHYHTEGRGTGIPKMLRAMKANCSPDPRFETDNDRTYFVNYFPAHPLAVSGENSNSDYFLHRRLLLHAGSTILRIPAS